MTQYKIVQVSNASTIGHDSSPQEALTQFQKAIENESSEGWELVCSHSISVTQYPEPAGCLGGLLVLVNLKPKPEIKIHNIDMLIFAKKA